MDDIGLRERSRVGGGSESDRHVQAQCGALPCLRYECQGSDRNSARAEHDDANVHTAAANVHTAAATRSGPFDGVYGGSAADGAVHGERGREG